MKWVPNPRLHRCHRVPLQSGGAVTLAHGPHGAAYHGLQVCGSVWSCPVCQAKITERRRQELREGVGRWAGPEAGKGGSLAMLTLTVPHYRRDDLEGLLAALADSACRFWRTRAVRSALGLVGMAARVRALEVTHGRHGWHPHFHVLLFLRIPATAEQLELVERVMRTAWEKAVLAAGLRKPGDSCGLTLQDGTRAARYVAKFGEEAGWSAAEELTRSQAKEARGKGRSPRELLAAASRGDRQAGRLYGEYAKAFAGMRQLSWSKGGRDAVGLGEEATDEELAAAPEESMKPLLKLEHWQWLKVLRRERRGQLLAVAAGGDAEACRAYIDDLCGGVRVPPRPEDEVLGEVQGMKDRWERLIRKPVDHLEDAFS